MKEIQKAKDEKFNRELDEYLADKGDLKFWVDQCELEEIENYVKGDETLDPTSKKSLIARLHRRSLNDNNQKHARRDEYLRTTRRDIAKKSKHRSVDLFSYEDGKFKRHEDSEKRESLKKKSVNFSANLKEKKEFEEEEENI